VKADSFGVRFVEPCDLWQSSIRRALSTLRRNDWGSIRFHVPIDASVDVTDARNALCLIRRVLLCEHEGQRRGRHRASDEGRLRYRSGQFRELDHAGEQGGLDDETDERP